MICSEAKDPPPWRELCLEKSNRPEATWGFAMKTFFSFILVFNPEFEGKITLHPSKNCLCPQARYTVAGPTTGTILTKPTKSAHPNKLIVSIVPTLPSLLAMPTDLACYAYRPCLLYLYKKQKTTLEVQLCCGTYLRHSGHAND